MVNQKFVLVITQTSLLAMFAGQKFAPKMQSQLPMLVVVVIVAVCQSRKHSIAVMVMQASRIDFQCFIEFIT